MLETEVELKKGEDERVMWRKIGEVEEDKQGRRRG